MMHDFFPDAAQTLNFLQRGQSIQSHDLASARKTLPSTVARRDARGAGVRTRSPAGEI
jgi:hypothetical protein